MHRAVDREFTATEFDGIASLSSPVCALFGGDLCSTPGWYRATETAAMLPGGRAIYVQISSQDAVLAVFPMLRDRRAGTSGSLSTPYTTLWRPVFAPELTTAQLTATGYAFARFARSWPVIRFDAMPRDSSWQSPLEAGFRRAGRRTLPFDHFGNWHIDLQGMDWAAYLGSRPGALREAIRRRTRRLLQTEGASFNVAVSEAGLEPAIAAFEAVYARSWKEPEPSPQFNAQLMRECARDRTLRLGLLHLGGNVVAAQFWVVTGTVATVLKLAHDEAHKALSPGTVLTALMIRRLMEQDAVVELDFGRGDDDYKVLWTGQRRQRIGWLLADPFTASGLSAICRHWAGEQRRTLRALIQGVRAP